MPLHKDVFYVEINSLLVNETKIWLFIIIRVEIKCVNATSNVLVGRVSAPGLCRADRTGSSLIPNRYFYL